VVCQPDHRVDRFLKLEAVAKNQVRVDFDRADVEAGPNLRPNPVARWSVNRFGGLRPRSTVGLET